MRIAYDITQTGKDKAGCGYFAYSLIRALAGLDRDNEYLLLNSFGENYWDGSTSPKSIGIHKPNIRPGIRHMDRTAAYRFWHFPPADLEKALGGPDIVHSNNFHCPSGLHQARLIYTLYDLSFMEHPEWTTEANRTACFEGVYKASLHADMLLAISEYSRSHFLRTFPHYPPDQVRVIYPASRYPKIKKRSERPATLPAQILPEKFWLCVGTLEPRKNHSGLLRAYARHKARAGKVLPLVHAGGPGWLMNDFKDQIRKMDLQQDVILLGYVDDDSLQWLYQNCFAFLYPSFFEGFGLPVLEALSQGAAVISSNTTSIPEIVGKAGMLVDPAVDEQTANAMDELVDDQTLLTTLRLAAPLQAESFNWERTAHETLKLYRSLRA